MKSLQIIVLVLNEKKTDRINRYCSNCVNFSYKKFKDIDREDLNYCLKKLSINEKLDTFYGRLNKLKRIDYEKKNF